jgi:hypothetical protein
VGLAEVLAAPTYKSVRKWHRTLFGFWWFWFLGWGYFCFGGFGGGVVTVGESYQNPTI